MRGHNQVGDGKAKGVDGQSEECSSQDLRRAQPIKNQMGAATDEAGGYQCFDPNKTSQSSPTPKSDKQEEGRDDC